MQLSKLHYFQLSLIAVGLWLVTLLPVIAGYMAAGPDRYFVARIQITASDTTAYYSNIEQARQGRWLLANQFTSETQSPSLLHPLWLVTGWLGNLLHLSTPWAYQAARLLAIWGALILFFRIIRSLFDGYRERWLALFLLVTSSGLGWLFGKHSDNALLVPPDIWVAESNTFQSIGHSALFIGTQALLLLLFWTFWQWTAGQRRQLPWWWPAVAGLLFLVHPYDIVTLVAVLAVWLGWKVVGNSFSGRQLLRAWPVFSATAVILVGVLWYFLKVVLTEPAMNGWLRQNIDITPLPHLVLIGYGLLIPLAMIGLATSWRRKPATAFLLTWAVVNLVIIYLPGLTFQRRLLSGLHIPLALLAAEGFIYLWRQISIQVLRPAMTLGLLIILGMTNIQNTVSDITVSIHPDNAGYPVYITRQEAEAIRWLGPRTTFQDVVFSEVWMGNTIPGLIGRTVVVGHGHQTLELQQRLRDWQALTLGQQSPADLTMMLQRLHVTWLFWRQTDVVPGGYNPDVDSRWAKRFHNATVSVYQLRSDLAQAGG